jgi:hypothetical protein
MGREFLSDLIFHKSLDIYAIPSVNLKGNWGLGDVRYRDLFE